MFISDYQDKVNDTAIYPAEVGREYTFYGLIGEIGEFANKYKKELRDGREFSKEDKESEAGDILWYMMQWFKEHNLDAEVVASKNIEKLRDRQNRGVLGGSGDNR